jgi:hypothetical protein
MGAERGRNDGWITRSIAKRAAVTQGLSSNRCKRVWRLEDDIGC